MTDKAVGGEGFFLTQLLQNLPRAIGGCVIYDNYLEIKGYFRERLQDLSHCLFFIKYWDNHRNTHVPVTSLLWG